MWHHHTHQSTEQTKGNEGAGLSEERRLLIWQRRAHRSLWLARVPGIRDKRGPGWRRAIYSQDPPLK